MGKTYRLGVLGVSHGHVNTLIDAFKALPSVEWVACADTVPSVPKKPSWRPAQILRSQERAGIPKVYQDYREMLEKESFDIMLFCPENAQHGEVAEAIAAKGIHMITEKPMSASLPDALRMVRAVRANDVELVVNWPTTWNRAIRKMKELIDAGAIGELWEVKWRNGASMGPLSYAQGANAWSDVEKGGEWWHHVSAGGGALLDYCCYGACLARWFVGAPAVSATAIRANIASQYGDADDNAIIAVRFPRSLAILEGTWTTWNAGVPTGPIAYGTRGTIVADRGVVQVFTTQSYGRTEPDMVSEGDPLPEGRATLGEEFIYHLETGEPLHPTLQLQHNIEAMAILDAGIRSSESGKVELVNNDATWCIG
jgi:predicted dehydrogenase